MPGPAARDNEPDGSRFRAATLPEDVVADKQPSMPSRCCAGSMTVATPGSKIRKRDPNPSVSKGRANRSALLAEMRPAVGMYGHDHRIGKRARGLDGVVGVHGEMERTAGLGCAGERQHHARP